jgi:hypothetical protein
MAYYLILCFLGMALFGAIIGWRQVLRWDSIAGFYLAIFCLAYFIRPWYIFDIRWFKHFYQLGVPPFRGWWAAEDLAIKMGLAVIVGLACFAAAYRWILTRPARKPISAERQPDSQDSAILRKRLVILSLALAAAALVSILVYLPFPGIRDVSSAIWVDLPDGSGRGFSGSTGYLVNLNLFSIPASILFFLGTGNIFGALALAVPFLLSRLWWGWGRQGLFTLGISLLLTAGLIPRLQPLKRLRTVIVSIIILAGVMGVFGVLGKSRQAFQSYYYTKSGPITNYVESTREEYLSGVVGFEISLHWLKFAPETFPFEWGANYFYQLFILPIPRIWWPGKHNIFASNTARTFYMSYLWGAAPGCIGDAWENGGWLGIIILFSLAGGLGGLAQRAKDWKSYPVTGLLLFVVAYPYAISAVRDGLSVLTTALYVQGIPILLTYLIEKRLIKSQDKRYVLRKTVKKTFAMKMNRE